MKTHDQAGDEMEKKPDPTHKITMYGVPGFLHKPSMSIWGDGPISDFLLRWVGEFHNFWVGVCVSVFPGWENPGGFPMRIIEEYSDDDKQKDS